MILVNGKLKQKAKHLYYKTGTAGNLLTAYPCLLILLCTDNHSPGHIPCLTSTTCI